MKIKITRSLRKALKQGHPWVYKEAIEAPKTKVNAAQFCQVVDNKGDLGWAIYDPHGPLSLRFLSTDKKPPGKVHFQQVFAKAYSLRRSLISERTNAYRLFNGEGDLLPGLVCDVYDSIAVLQFDGQGPGEFWNRQWIAEWIVENTPCKTVVEKFRRSMSEKGLHHIFGKEIPGALKENCRILENEAVFAVNLEKGQKTGFFLDQRDNRQFVGSRSQEKSVLNLFSYTGGFSIYAGRGGAKDVTSVDISEGAIKMAEENWALNKLEASRHTGVAEDVFHFLKATDRMWDHIIVDPPSMTHSEDQKQIAKSKYIEAFSEAALKVNSGGEFSLSSCSSHITFEDFFEIISESLSNARRKGQIVRVSGQGIDHPFPHSCHELRYLKFVHLILD
jgi:23S rRNA (cytosine1962-C5)-methyltransferase